MGASFTGLTVRFAVMVPVEKAVASPLVLVSVLLGPEVEPEVEPEKLKLREREVEALPLVPSQARRVRLAVSPFSPSGL